MINAQVEIIVIASLTAIACSLPGVFVIMRKMTLVTDAIAKSVLLGIVLGFCFVQTIHSPLTIIMATVAGVIAIFIIELLSKTKLVYSGVAISIVAAFTFSVAIVIVSLFISQMQLDSTAILMGELAFAPLNRAELFGTDIGPVAYYQIGGITLLNITLFFLFYNDIKISAFDGEYATTLDIRSRYIHYGLIVLLSLTIAVAFEVVGTILVVGLIIGPATVASLYTNRLWLMIILAPIIGVISSLWGYSFAQMIDASIAGCITMIIGILFGISKLFAPHGILMENKCRKQQDYAFMIDILLVHLWQHELYKDTDDENHADSIAVHLNWQLSTIKLLVKSCELRRYIYLTPDGIIALLPAGVGRAERALER